MICYFFFVNQKKSILTATKEVRKICCYNIAKYLSWLPDLSKRNY